MGRKGQLCRVLVRGARNSCLVEFVEDGFKAVTSRNALQKSLTGYASLPILAGERALKSSRLKEQRAMKNVTAVILALLMLVNPLLGVNHHRPEQVTKDGLAIDNNLLDKILPTGTEVQKLGLDVKEWAAKRKADGTLAAAESTILKNAGAFIAGKDQDAKTLYSSLQQQGYKGDQESIEKSLKVTTREQRKALVEKIQNEGLYSTVMDTSTGLDNLSQQLDGGAKGQDGWPCSYYIQLGGDLMALSGILAFAGQEEAAVPMAATGAVLLFYGEYACD